MAIVLGSILFVIIKLMIITCCIKQRKENRRREEKKLGEKKNLGRVGELFVSFHSKRLKPFKRIPMARTPMLPSPANTFCLGCFNGNQILSVSLAQPELVKTTIIAPVINN